MPCDPRKQRHPRRATRGSGARRGAAALFGIALQLASSGAARAEETAPPGQGDDPWHSLLEGLDIRAKRGRPPDFVEATRPDPARLNYIPAGAVGAKRPDPVRTAAQIKAAEAALDAARLRQLQGPPPAPPKAAKPPPLAKRVTAARRPAAAD